MAESEQLADLLIRWEELRQQGGNPSAEQLCSDCPQLVSGLKRRIRALQKMESVLGIASTASDAPSSVPGMITRGPVESDRPLPTIPEYEIVEILGRGGMGVVYRARQLKLGRTVAVKMLDAALTGTRHLERFLDEAHAVARLRHPNIVQIFDFGQVENVPFFSMELVEGGNLKDRVADGPLDIEDAVRLTEIIARAIHLVHLEGFAHRDLKPANILLTADGQPKVTDFGLVKRLDDKSGHTSPGEILGTIGYMAPEQLDNSHAEIGPRTDVYALGTLLYEMLIGEPPFASNPALTLRQVLQDDAPMPTRVRPGVPRDVEAICLKCLEKDVADRYATAEALADDLRRFSEHRPILARRIGIARRTLKWVKRRPQVAAFMLVIAAIATAWPMVNVVGERRASADRHAQAVRVAPLAREILQRNCYACHGSDPDNVRKQLDILYHDLLLDSARRIVVPGHPDDSRLIQRITDGSMPPEDMEETLPRLTEKELVILRKWILGGAPKFPAEDPMNPTLPVVGFSQIAAEAKEVFQEQCYTCHRYDDAKGGIRILHHRLLLHVRKVVVPGNSDESELFQLLVSNPPHPSKPLSAAKIDIIQRWIDNGAPPFPKSED